MSYRIAAVVLSYNYIDSLNKVIDAVKHQSTSVNKIFIVDNGTADEEWMNFAVRHKDCQLIKLDNNYGVGYGHNAGWKKVLAEGGFDFIWAIEHDAVPFVDCLEQLLIAYQGYDHPEKLSAIQPIEVGSFDFANYRYYRVNGLRLKPVVDYVNRKVPTTGFGISFNGALFRVPVITEVGLLTESFFVGLEDIEYNQRLNRAGYKVLNVPLAKVNHQLLKNSAIIKIGKKAIIFSKTSLGRYYYVMRNSLYMGLNKLYLLPEKNKFVLVSFVLRSPLAVLKDLLFFRNGYKRVFCRIAALRDALASNMGKKNYWFLK